jgi:prophage regulatory protein
MENLLSITEVCKSTSLSKTSIYTLIKMAEFPAALHLSARRVAWRASEIEAWISRKAEAVTP